LGQAFLRAGRPRPGQDFEFLEYSSKARLLLLPPPPPPPPLLRLLLLLLLQLLLLSYPYPTCTLRLSGALVGRPVGWGEVVGNGLHPNHSELSFELSESMLGRAARESPGDIGDAHQNV